MRLKLRHFIFAAIAAASLTACNPVAVLGGADSAIERFHQQFGAGQMHAIWDGTSSEMRQLAPEADFLAFMEQTRQIMGEVQSSERNGFYINTNNGVTTATVTMQTVFANGEGTEEFVWKQDGEDWQLMGYHITSPLMENAPGAAK